MYYFIVKLVDLSSIGICAMKEPKVLLLLKTSHKEVYTIRKFMSMGNVFAIYERDFVDSV